MAAAVMLQLTASPGTRTQTHRKTWSSISFEPSELQTHNILNTEASWKMVVPRSLSIKSVIISVHASIISCPKLKLSFKLSLNFKTSF